MSNNIALGMTNKISYSKSQSINQLQKSIKKIFLKTILSKKTNKTKAMQVFTLPIRYVVNTMLMIVSFFKSYFSVKKDKSKWTDYLSFFICVGTIALAAYFCVVFGSWTLFLTAIIALGGLLLLITLWIIVRGRVNC